MVMNVTYIIRYSPTLHILPRLASNHWIKQNTTDDFNNKHFICKLVI